MGPCFESWSEQDENKKGSERNFLLLFAQIHILKQYSSKILKWTYHGFVQKSMPRK